MASVFASVHKAPELRAPLKMSRSPSRPSHAVARTKTVYYVGLGSLFVGMVLTVIAVIILWTNTEGPDKLPNVLIAVGTVLFFLGLSAVF